MATPNIIWHPMADIIKAYLIEQGVGFAYNIATEWAIATQAMPIKPLNVITIYDEAAEMQYRSIGNGVQEAPVVVIEIRSTTLDEGMYKAKKIMEVLDALNRWTWTGGGIAGSKSVLFKDGNPEGVTPIIGAEILGDSVEGVLSEVYLTSGSWAGGNAAGTMVIIEAVGGFSIDKTMSQLINGFYRIVATTASIGIVLHEQTIMIATANRARGIFPLGQDDNKRWVFNLEYSLTIQSITE